MPRVVRPVTERVPDTERLDGEKLVATRSVKRARVEKRVVEVALVDVELVELRLVIVEEAPLERIFPKVPRPVTVTEPRVPTEVREEPTTEEPRAVEERTVAPLMVKALLVGRFRLPAVMLTPPLNVEVAVEVEVRKPTVSEPEELEAN